MSQQINLFNARFRKKKNYFTAEALAAGLGVILLGSLGMAMVAKQRVAKLEAEAAQVQERLTAAENRKAAAGGGISPRQKSAELEQQLAQAESDNRALKQVGAILDKGEFGNTRGYSAYFRAFARTRVNGLWLTGVQINGAANEIGLQGRTLQAGLLPGYLNGLSREPVLKGKSFGQLEMGQPKPATLVQTALPGQAAAVAPTVPYVEFSLQAVPAAGERQGGNATAEAR
ncbi:hypothetical protein [Pseudoduganella namucuonensis]|uniref:MSHA biogenesis protein MshI n=1 Tax=Pseudoduganella namucuonensis TaxID=1035707 RepID=A0A1I7L5J6_9BURK|nr:hypothetical protein [Pseudoduganella namucuonensis]SFV05052.1 hypothetical protein SAMN05216552_102389 [Pseudoduganella namucuonensis]